MPILHLQPGPGVGLDTYIRTYPHQNNNYGNSTYLETTQIGGTLFNFLLKFLFLDNEGGPIPQNSIINSATLSLYHFLHSFSDGIIYTYRIKVSWSEMQTTWNLRHLPSSYWSIPGCEGIDDRRLSSDDPPAICSDATEGTFISFPVTQLIQEIVNLYTNHGFFLKSSTASKDRFFSSDYSTIPSRRPILDIDYTPFNPFSYKSKFFRLNFP